MLCLAFDASSVAVSVALADEHRLYGEVFIQNGLTHSATLLPLVDACLQQTGKTLGEVGLLAVCAGPGSFTGVRIAVATAMGLAGDRPVAGVNTLEALAAQAEGFPGLVCPLLDARVGQVYAAVYRAGKAVRPPEALPLAQLLDTLQGQPCLFVGDGAPLVTLDLANEPAWRLASPALLGVHAAWAATLALARPETWAPAAALRPIYLRAPQAERQRAERLRREADTHG